MSKRKLLWLVVRMIVSCGIAIGCLSAIGAGSTPLFLLGVAGFLAMLYYWLPANINIKENN